MVECPISSTGNDDVLLILGVNILERDNDLEIEGFSLRPEEEPSGVAVVAFSVSVGVRYLKLNFGRMLLMDDFPFDAEEGPGELFVGASTEREVTRKFTFLGVGVGLGVCGILIATKSWEHSSGVLEGISRRRFCLFRGGTCVVSSVIPIGSSSYKYNMELTQLSDVGTEIQLSYISKLSK